MRVYLSTVFAFVDDAYVVPCYGVSFLYDAQSYYGFQLRAILFLLPGRYRFFLMLSPAYRYQPCRLSYTALLPIWTRHFIYSAGFALKFAVIEGS